jgi:O-antigen/teichoic acid export membrane protein
MIQVVNLVTGFVILRSLGVEEYAIYVLAAIVQAIGAIGSDLGVSHGVTSIGASLRDERPAFEESVIRGAMRLRRHLFWPALPAMFLVPYLILRDNVPRLNIGAAIVALTIVNVWVQQSAAIATSVLNAQHDSSGLFRAGMGSALVRFVLAVTLCTTYPYALAALTVNVVGTMVLSWRLWAQYGGYDRMVQADDARYLKDLFRFALPLLPVNI